MTTRKSARLTAKAEAVTAPEQAQNASQQVKKPRARKAAPKVDVVEKEKRSRKKQKTADAEAGEDKVVAIDKTTRAIRTKGQLKVMAEMPEDILLEIFSHLHPIDLLYLSRASKYLHNLLTSKNTASVWKSSYHNLPHVERPPLCPQDFNIVYYTNYVYGRGCQLCPSAYGSVFHDTAFIRLCTKCADKFLLELSKKKLRLEVLELCNLCHIRQRGRCVLIMEYKYCQQELLRAKSDNNVAVYQKQRKAIKSARDGKLVWWRSRLKRVKQLQMVEIRRKRKYDIIKRLSDEGKDVRFIYHEFRRLRHVQKAQELTDAEWTAIRADFLDVLQDREEEIVVAEKQHELMCRIYKLNDFVNSRLNSSITPTAFQIASSEPFLSLIKSSCKLTKGILEEHSQQLSDFQASWRDETDKYLTTLMPRPTGKGKKKSVENPLELAATFFKCYWCTEPISYPRILMHRCLIRPNRPEEDEDGQDANKGANEKMSDDDNEDLDEDEEEKEENATANPRGARQPRPPRIITADTVWPLLSDVFDVGMHAGKAGVTFDFEAHKVARDIIAICGEDPNTATNATMEEKNARLECLRCNRAMQEKPRSKFARLILTWALAVFHDLTDHYGEGPSKKPVWRLIDSEEDLTKIKEEEEKMSKLKKYQKSLLCNYCGFRQTGTQNQLTHLRVSHAQFVKNPSEHFHMGVDASILESTLPAVKL